MHYIYTYMYIMWIFLYTSTWSLSTTLPHGLLILSVYKWNNPPPFSPPTPHLTLGFALDEWEWEPYLTT